MSVESANRVWVEKIHKKVKKLPYEGRGSVLSDLEGVPKWKEGPETLQKTVLRPEKLQVTTVRDSP